MAVPTSITDLSTTAASNSPAGSDSIGNPGTIDDYFRGYGKVTRDESLNKWWERCNDTPSYSSGTVFTVPADLTARYTAGRRVKCTVTAGTVYGTIVSSAYTSSTAVTCVFDTGSLDAGLSEVMLGAESKFWTMPQFSTTPVSMTAGYTNDSLEVTKDQQGFVHLKGRAYKDSAGTGQLTYFTLATGYRPDQATRKVVNNETDVAVVCLIGTDGTVKVTHLSNNNAATAFDFSFPTT